MSAGAAKGRVAWLGKVSVDNRKLSNLDVPSTAVPLMYLREQVEGHRGAEVAGAVKARVVRGVLTIEGDVYDLGIPAGTYGAGVDLSYVETLEDGEVLVINAATLLGITMYDPESGATPAFVNARVTVTR